jgi:hypothetical protein
MKCSIACVVLVGLLVACTGIPLRSIPRLMNLQQELLDANPAEFMLAIQVDARMTPPLSAVPILHLAIRPDESSAFDAVERKLPMRFTVASADQLGLASPPPNRRWLIYSFSAESQAELSLIQKYFKQIRAQPRANSGGGSISVGIAQDGVAAKDPALANTRWESWLRTSRQEGFFQLWSGSIAALIKQAKTEAAAAPSRPAN